MTAPFGPVTLTGCSQLIEQLDRGNLQHFGPPGRQVLKIDNWRSTSLTRMEHLQAAELIVTDAVWRAGFILARSHLDALSMRRCRTAESIYIEDCTIHVLDLRALKGRITLNRCRVEQLLVHDVQHLTMSDVTGSHLRVSAVSASFSGASLTCDALRVSDVSGEHTTRLALVDVRAREQLTLEDLACSAVDGRRISAGSLLVRDLSAESVSLTDTVVAEAVVRGLAGIAGASCPVVLSGLVAGALELRSAREGRANVRLVDTQVAGDLTVTGSVTLTLESGRIGGVLLREHSAQPPTLVRLEPAFEVGAVNVPTGRIGNGSQAMATARKLMGSDGAEALSTLRRSLEGRPREQDQVYFAQRRAQAPHGIAGAFDWLQRWVFGYGVRLAEPAGALIVAIFLTALVVQVAEPGITGGRDARSWGLDDWARSLALAAQLWFNVGIGLPTGVSGARWALTAVVLTMAGVLLVTTLIGIALRRLIR